MKKKKITSGVTVLTGVITDGGVESEGVIYPFGWAGSKTETRGEFWFLAGPSSFSKKRVKDYLGYKAIFIVDRKNQAYNIDLLDDDGNLLKKEALK